MCSAWFSFGMTKYVKPREAADYFGVCLHTLRRWEQKGWINATRTPSGRARRYDLDSYIRVPKNVRKVVLYARVSSRGQKPDLERQIARLVGLYSGAEVVGEVGGGLNFKRPKFLALLERVRARDVGTIVVAHRDRLCRFGFEFVEWYCHQYGCEVVVLGQTIKVPIVIHSCLSLSALPASPKSSIVCWAASIRFSGRRLRNSSVGS